MSFLFGHFDSTLGSDGQLSGIKSRCGLEAWFHFIRWTSFSFSGRSSSSFIQVISQRERVSCLDILIQHWSPMGKWVEIKSRCGLEGKTKSVFVMRASGTSTIFENSISDVRPFLSHMELQIKLKSWHQFERSFFVATFVTQKCSKLSTCIYIGYRVVWQFIMIIVFFFQFALDHNMVSCCFLRRVRRSSGENCCSTWR